MAKYLHKQSISFIVYNWLDYPQHVTLYKYSVLNSYDSILFMNQCQENISIHVHKG